MVPSERDFSVGDEADLLEKGGVFVGKQGRSGMPGKNLLATEKAGGSIEIPSKNKFDRNLVSGSNSHMSNSGSAAQGAVVSEVLLTSK